MGIPKKASAAARLLQSKRKNRRGGRPKVLRKCRYCRRKFSARDMRAHLPLCPSR